MLNEIKKKFQKVRTKVRLDKLVFNVSLNLRITNCVSILRSHRQTKFELKIYKNKNNIFLKLNNN